VSAGTAVSEVSHGSPASAGVEQIRSLIGNPAALVAIALIALAAFLRFYRIGHQGFWFDEANTALLVHFPLGKMLGLVPQSESTPPLYYCVAWVWARVFGYREAGLRSLSALAGVLTVPVAYAAGAKLISRRSGLVVAGLCASNPFLIWYSQEARSYALLVLLSAASLLAFAYVLERPSPRTSAAWVIASGLALATHYYAVLAVAPEALWLLFIHRRSRAVHVAVALVALCGLALIPLAISQEGTGNASWIGGISLVPRLRQMVPQFLIGFQAPAYETLLRVAEAIAAIGLVALLARADALERRGALIAGSIAVGGLVVNLLLIAAGTDDLITRNLLALWLPAALLVAGGLGARRAGAAGIAAAVALCAIGITGAVAVTVNRSFQRPDWRAVAGALGTVPAAASPGRAILVQHYSDLLPLSLYLPGLKFVRGSAGADVTELDVVSFSAPRVDLCWWGAACNLTPSRLQSSYPVPGLRVLWRRRADQFTMLHMVTTGGPVLLTRAAVARVLRTTTLRRDELLVQR
jgi:4-amino-4-deoxy-L-arabinose transferase-like glycosyltransferase